MEYEQELKKLADMQTNQLVKQLDYKKNSELSGLQREEAIAKPKFQNQRVGKNTASQIQKLNFAEFMNRRGQTNAGFANTAELSRQNVLARNISEIDTAENHFNTDMANRRQDINSAYNNELTTGKIGIQQSMADKLLAFKEQLRQEKLQREAEDRTYQRSLNSKSTASAEYNFSDSVENTGTTQNSFADQYIENMISSAKRTGLKYNAMAVGQELADLKSQGKITQQEYQAMIVELQNQSLIG